MSNEAAFILTLTCAWLGMVCWTIAVYLTGYRLGQFESRQTITPSPTVEEWQDPDEWWKRGEQSPY